jgi:hypothetical protein
MKRNEGRWRIVKRIGEVEVMKKNYVRWRIMKRNSVTGSLRS